MRKRDIASETTRETGRIEAFSDGVFAIAITLLVLDMKVPHAHDLHEPLRIALLRQWPTYLAFLTSFATILIMWVNHHRIFRTIRRTDHAFLILNGLLLLIVTVIPFPTSLLAEYIEHRDARIAALVYSGTHVVLAVVFNGLWRYASDRNRLLDARADPELVQSITRSYRFGPLLYLIAFGAAWVNVAASVALCLALAIFFALPGKGD